MKTISDEKLLKNGGKLWEKGTASRIYIDQNAILTLAGIKESELSDFEKKSIKKSKTFFDKKTDELKSDVGTVRVLLNSHGVKCVK